MLFPNHRHHADGDDATHDDPRYSHGDNVAHCIAHNKLAVECNTLVFLGNKLGEVRSIRAGQYSKPALQN